MNDNDFELQEIKWLNAKTNEPKEKTFYWILIRFENGMLRGFCAQIVHTRWAIVHTRESIMITKDMEVLSFFELPSIESSPTFDN